MFFLVVIAFIANIFCIFLHYSQHFRCNIDRKRRRWDTAYLENVNSNQSSGRQRNLSINNSVMTNFKSPKRCCQACFTSVDGESFDAFPLSFFFYLLFNLTITLLVFIKEIYTEHDDFNQDEDYEIYDKFHYVKNPLYRAIKIKNITWKTKTEINTEIDKYSHIIDWFIIYSVLILLISESLFNCYRYLTMKHSANHITNVSPYYVFKHFILYSLGFILLFIIDIQVYYWLFPLIVISHFIFNVYCIYKFCAILIERYKDTKFTEVERPLRQIHDQLLKTVYIMRRASIISTIFTSLYILIFITIYDVQIVIYIPLLWTCSNISFLFNFVRNRVWMQRKLFTITRYCTKNNNDKNKSKISPSPTRSNRSQMKMAKSTLINSTQEKMIMMTNNNNHKRRIAHTPHPSLDFGHKPSSNESPINATPINSTDNDTSPPTADPLFIKQITLTIPNAQINVSSDNDSTPNTQTTPAYITPIIKNMNRSQSQNLLSVPSPITITNANNNDVSTAEDDGETKTPATDDGSEYYDKYQNWHSMNKHKSVTPTTPIISGDISSINNIFKTSKLNISIPTNQKIERKGRRKAFSLFGLEKDYQTPLTQGTDNDDNNIARNTRNTPSPYTNSGYNMNPLNVDKNQLQYNDNDDEDDDEVSAACDKISDSSDDEEPLPFDDEHERKEPQTPYEQVVTSLKDMMKKAASLVRSNSDEKKDINTLSVPLSIMQPRTRSYSDPTSVKVLATQQNPTFKSLNDEKDEKDDNDDNKDNDKLILDPHKESADSDHSNKSAPGIDAKSYRYKIRHGNSMKSSSYHIRSLENDDDYHSMDYALHDNMDDDEQKYLFEPDLTLNLENIPSLPNIPNLDNNNNIRSNKLRLTKTSSDPLNGRNERNERIERFHPTIIGSNDEDPLLAVLVSQGFYSRKSLNNAKQLRLYLNNDQ